MNTLGDALPVEMADHTLPDDLVARGARATYAMSTAALQAAFPPGWQQRSFEELEPEEQRLHEYYFRASIAALTPADIVLVARRLDGPLEVLFQGLKKLAAPDWRAMETAPKNGTRILVRYRDAGEWTVDIASWLAGGLFCEPIEYRDGWSTGWNQYESLNEVEPEGWMPLPDVGPAEPASTEGSEHG